MKALLIEDNPGDVELITRAIRAMSMPIDFSSEIRLQDALDRKDIADFDVILSDLSLPDSSGLNCIQKLNQQVPYVPIVVLTSLTSDNTAIEAIRQGAQDYLVKDQVNSDMLNRSIRHAIERQTMRIENERLVSELAANKSLLEAKNSRLEQLFEAAQTSVDNVSHEFRTPLAIMMEYSSIMRDEIIGPVNDEQRRFLEIINDRGNDLNNMVNDMLDVSRLESGLMGVTRARHSVSEILDHVLPSLCRKAKVRGCTIIEEISPELPMVFCDSEKVGRVIINLVVNAIKFCGGDGRIVIKVEQTSHSEIKFTVSDNGPGIPKDRMEMIFERFSQAHCDGRQTCKGFGLGLSIAQNLVALNFGRMTVESQEGHGSTFGFTLSVSDPKNVIEQYVRWLHRHPDATNSVSAVVAQADDPEMADETDDFLRYVLRPLDLALRVDSHQWVLLLNTSPIEVDCFLHRVQNEHDFLSRNRPQGPLGKISMSFQRSAPIDKAVETSLQIVEELSKKGEMCNV